MKITRTLKTITLAAAAGLITLGVNSPKLKGLEWWPNGQETVDSVVIYDLAHVDSADVTITTGGNVTVTNIVNVGTNSSTGTITVEGSGKLSADGMLMQRGSELIIRDSGEVKIGGNIDIDQNATGGKVEVIGTNASLLVGSICGTGPGEIIFGNTDSLILIDGGTVTANDISGGGELKIINGGMIRAYTDASNSGTVYVSGLRITLGLISGAAWRTPIFIDEHIDIFGVPSLKIDSGVVFAAGDTFTIMQAVRDLSYLSFGTSITDVGTNQVFDISGDAHNIILTAQAVPEPSTYALMGGIGAVALAMLRRRRKG